MGRVITGVDVVDADQTDLDIRGAAAGFLIGGGVFGGVPLKGYGTSMPGWSSLRANNRYAIFRPATGNTQTENAAYVDALFNPLPLTYDTYDATLNRYTVKIDREALAAGEIRGQKIDRRVQYFLGLGDLEAGETFKITHNYGVPWPGPKFWCPDIEQNYDSNNYRIFRYADAILMMAECYCNLENAEETMRYLNMVRQRAGVDPVTNFTGFEDLTLAVRCERARELGGEFQRKFDLVRWGIWYDQTYAYTNNATLKGKMRPCHRYYPIPDAQCALSGYVLTNDEYLADGL